MTGPFVILLVTLIHTRAATLSLIFLGTDRYTVLHEEKGPRAFFRPFLPDKGEGIQYVPPEGYAP